MVARFVAAAMIAVGVLITLTSGACTGYFLFILWGNVKAGDAIINLTSVLGFGLPIIAVGLALVIGGRALGRRGRF